MPKVRWVRFLRRKDAPSQYMACCASVCVCVCSNISSHPATSALMSLAITIASTISHNQNNNGEIECTLHGMQMKNRENEEPSHVVVEVMSTTK